MSNVSENVQREDLEKEREQTALDQLLAKVSADAAKDPRAFLEATIVPEGGE